MSGKVTTGIEPIEKTKVIDEDVAVEEIVQQHDTNSNQKENMTTTEAKEETTTTTAVDSDKLAALRAKLKKDETVESLPQKAPPPEKQVSLKFGVIGLGQGGSRIAERFHALGYPTIVANTATQDLTHIDVPEENKLFMDIGLQGAAKNIDRGQEAAEQYREQLQELVFDKLGSAQVLVLASSCGGGSGAGSIPVAIEMLQAVGKPIVVIGVLPMVSEDVKTKANSLETVSKLAGFVNEGKIHNLVIVDNARIESIYSGVGQMEFYRTANTAIVEPFEVFNNYSMMPSDVKSLDSSEWATLLLNSQGLSVYGQLSIQNYTEDTSIAEGVISSLSDNLLASSFDLKQAKYVGFLVIANKDVWTKVPAGSVNYASIMVNDIFGNPEGLFKGVYVSDDSDDSIKIYTFVSGLGLPEMRLGTLKKEVELQQGALKEKDKERANKLNLDTNKDTAVSDVEKLKSKIASKMSGFGKLNANVGVVDRRKR